MSTFLTVLLVLAMLGVFGVLGVGVATMLRGGNPRLSNKLMQGRVIMQAQVARLEREIDRMNAGLKPLDSFILPGGTPAAAYLHLARTIVRRAERLACALAAEERVNPEAIKYLNRLSDHLFVLGRRLNDNGARDVLWQPGLTRDGTS